MWEKTNRHSLTDTHSLKCEKKECKNENNTSEKYHWFDLQSIRIQYPALTREKKSGPDEWNNGREGTQIKHTSTQRNREITSVATFTTFFKWCIHVDTIHIHISLCVTITGRELNEQRIFWYISNLKKKNLTHKLNTVDRVKEIERTREKKWNGKREIEIATDEKYIHPHSGQLSRTNVYRWP